MSNIELQEYIESSIKIITKRLNLRPPRIEFDEYDSIGYYNREPKINISLEDLKKGCSKWDIDICPLKINNFQDRVYFIMSHEVGHYFQHMNFPKWYHKYREQKNNTEWKSTKEYAQTKLEKNEKLNLDFVIPQDIILQRTDNNNFKILLDRTGRFLGNLLKKVK